MKPLYCFVSSLLMLVVCFGQKPTIYPFLKDDSTIKSNYYNRAIETKNKLLANLPKEYKKDYKEIYESRSDAIAEMLKSSETLTEPNSHAYLQSVLKKVVEANPELKGLEIRMVFTRDIVPNAYSMGEGTILVNAGFLIYLDNEAQLAFTICHELAHLYLDHGNKKIKQGIELTNSEDLKKEAKQLSKQQYQQGQKFEELIKKYSFMQSRFSRDAESEADKLGFHFLRMSGYDCHEAKTCLQLLDVIDDTSFYQPIKLNEVFGFEEYPFKRKWIENESSIFASMSGDNNILTKAEKDSMKTHPDCLMRMAKLEDSINKVSGGFKFTNEKTFKKIQEQFIPELAEEIYQSGNLGYHLYLSLQLMQKDIYRQYAIFSTVRTLNRLFELQKTHKLGTAVDRETRFYKKDYNLLLRMIDRVKLEDIANLAYSFAKKYSGVLQGNSEFEKELRKAEKFKSEN